MKIEVSIGEIVDKLAILKIKSEHIKDEIKLSNVLKEYDYLYDVVFNDLGVDLEDFKALIEINQKLWHIEDALREKERDRTFDSDFIELARSVYFTNDKRAEIKKRINVKYSSEFTEEKSYARY